MPLLAGAGRVANSVDPDETPVSCGVWSDLNCPLMSVCPNT